MILLVPLGIALKPVLLWTLAPGASLTCQGFIGDAGSPQINVITVFTGAGETSENPSLLIPPFAPTNTSAHVQFAQTIAAGIQSSSALRTYGWIHRRGQGRRSLQLTIIATEAARTDVVRRAKPSSTPATPRTNESARSHEANNPRKKNLHRELSLMTTLLDSIDDCLAARNVHDG